jgi:hypothetical protein
MDRRSRSPYRRSRSPMRSSLSISRSPSRRSLSPKRLSKLFTDSENRDVLSEVNKYMDIQNRGRLRQVSKSFSKLYGGSKGAKKEYMEHKFIDLFKNYMDNRKKYYTGEEKTTKNDLIKAIANLDWDSFSYIPPEMMSEIKFLILDNNLMVQDGIRRLQELMSKYNNNPNSNYTKNMIKHIFNDYEFDSTNAKYLPMDVKELIQDIMADSTNAEYLPMEVKEMIQDIMAHTKRNPLFPK